MVGIQKTSNLSVLQQLSNIGPGASRAEHVLGEGFAYSLYVSLQGFHFLFHFGDLLGRNEP